MRGSYTIGEMVGEMWGFFWRVLFWDGGLGGDVGKILIFMENEWLLLCLFSPMSTLVIVFLKRFFNIYPYARTLSRDIICGAYLDRARGRRGRFFF